MEDTTSEIAVIYRNHRQVERYVTYLEKKKIGIQYEAQRKSARIAIYT